MRVVGGSKRGLRLAGISDATTRPTADRVKEALFNILADRAEGAIVLDLFAGSGALGIEALSRGAQRAVFVERDRNAVRVVQENLRRARYRTEATIVAADAFSVLNNPARLGGPFDIIFADPPYHGQLAAKVLAALEDGSLLTADGLLVIEHERREELPPRRANVEQIRSARYGDTMLSFFVTRSVDDGAEAGEDGATFPAT